MILNWELRDVLPELRPEGRLNVLITLILHANSRLRCWPSVERLIDETGFFSVTVIAAKNWLLERGAIVLVPFQKRVGQEKTLPIRQHVYQLTGVLKSAAGQWVRYLYLTPEAEADLRGWLEQLEVSPGETLPGKSSLTESEGSSTTEGVHTSASSDAADAAGEDGPPPPEEPRYTDSDDPWEDDGKKLPKWALPDVKDKLLMRALRACRRKTLEKGDKYLWRQVRQALMARKMTEEWAMHCIAYAHDKQPMKFANLVKWMLNPAKMMDWEQRRLGEMPREEPRPKKQRNRVPYDISAGPDD